MLSMAIIFVLLAVIADFALSYDPTVQLKNGSYVGIYDPNYNQDIFLGMPFAQPPVGSLRFRAPQPLDSAWNDTRSAVSYGNSCPA